MKLKTYQTTTLREKPLSGLIRAMKESLKPLVVGGFLFFSLFLIIPGVFASPILTDYFDGYAAGALNGQGSWNCTDNTLVSSTNSYSVPYSAEKDLLTGICKKSGTGQTTGEVGFYLKSFNCGYSGVSSGFYFGVGHAPFYNFFYALVGYSGYLGGSCRVVFSLVDGADYYEPLTFFDNWQPINIQWRLEVDNHYSFRFSYGGNDFTAWQESGYTTDLFPTIDYLGFSGTAQNNFYIDNIGPEILPIDCADYLTMNTCQNYLPTCCWGWDYQAQNFKCDFCPSSECTLTPNPYTDCAFCLTQPTCAAQSDHCYWWAGGCKYGTKKCGADLKLQFCLTEGECTTAGGHWYGDFCWVSPLMGLISWSDYYDTYGDYETPSDWINDLSASVESFFGKVGGLIFSFTENFDIAEALFQGESLGSAIPKARAYLGIFDSFFGDFPIGDIFLFVLVLMLAVGIFRLFRNLKFW
jgi:hypothetical protein